MYHLKLEAKKVQSFIFKVPILKYMIGANSALGEFFNYDLVELKKRSESLDESKIKKITEIFSEVYGKIEICPYDNVFENTKAGVFSASGGHFETIFSKKENLIKFYENVIEKAHQKIPGIMLKFELHCIYFEDENNFKDDSNYVRAKLEKIEKNKTENIVNNPYFEICKKDGMNHIKISNENNEEKESSENIKKIYKQREKFINLEGKEILCNFYKENIEQFKKNLNIGEFSALCSKKDKNKKNNYYALIAMDGNSMGKRFNEKLEEIKPGESSNVRSCKDIKEIKNLIKIEKFWYESRKNIREALKYSIKEIKNKFNFIILMMGGDDILIAIEPKYAFDFVKKFNEYFSEFEDKITFSSGIAFINHNYPFNYAHEIAEECLSSAKTRLKNIKNKNNITSIDWHINYDTYKRPLNEIRNKDYVLYYENEENHLDILSGRPYLINLDTAKESSDFEEIYEKVKKLAEKIKKDEKADKETIEKTNGRNKILEYYFSLKKGIEYSDEIRKFIFQNTDFDEILPKTKKIKLNDKYINKNNSYDVIELLDFFMEEGEKYE